MELRSLRAFTVLADELSFKDASARLGVRQSTLSETITRLEHEVGSPLFDRGRRRMPALTPLGAVLASEARLLLEHADRVAALVTEESVTAAPLKVAAISSVFAGLLPAVVRRLHERLPTASIRLLHVPDGFVHRRLVDGELDFAFGRLYDAPDDVGFELLADEALWAVLPADHRLAGAAEIDLADLADEPFVIFNRDEGATGFDAITSACRNAGFGARVRNYVTDDLALLSTVASGLGVSLVPAISTRHAFEGTVYVRLSDTATTPLCLLWRLGAATPLADEFREVVHGEVEAVMSALR